MNLRLIACAALLTHSTLAGSAGRLAAQVTRTGRDPTPDVRVAPPGAPHGRTLAPPPASGRSFEEVRRYPAPEATQGVGVDEEHFYAIGNYWIAKYERSSGRKVDEWRGERDGPVIHLNSCLAVEGRLICGHSNYPGLPMLSSIEVWDTGTLEHVESRSFGVYEGSLTWALPRDGDWWLSFAHYAGPGGTPGKGPEWTTLVRFDSAWRRLAGFAYPVALVEKIAPHSVSGGNWGSDGRLYVTGHDDPEVYVLQLPEMGSVLEWVETIPAPMHGQAWAFDPLDPDTVWGIVRATREVVVGTRRSDR